MDWYEFVALCNKAMIQASVSKHMVKVRVEVSDSYYDQDVTPESIGVALYDDGPRLVITGKM